MKSFETIESIREAIQQGIIIENDLEIVEDAGRVSVLYGPTIVSSGDCYQMELIFRSDNISASDVINVLFNDCSLHSRN